MSLSAGARLGPYEIVSVIGVGGMGEVYRSHDGKLQRDVALKVLPELFASDADRLSRFEREARVLGSLNHSNIAHIYGLDESSGVRASAPKRLFALAEGLGSPIVDQYAVTQDGRSFLIAEPIRGRGVEPISIIVNWRLANLR